jgi:hypothetical protein
MKSMPQAVPAAATGLSGTDDDVFTRLRDNAEKRYVGGDAPMVGAWNWGAGCRVQGAGCRVQGLELLQACAGLL